MPTVTDACHDPSAFLGILMPVTIVWHKAATQNDYFLAEFVFLTAAVAAFQKETWIL